LSENAALSLKITEKPILVEPREECQPTIPTGILAQKGGAAVRLCVSRAVQVGDRTVVKGAGQLRQASGKT
jgi:hypothetical protein